MSRAVLSLPTVRVPIDAPPKGYWQEEDTGKKKKDTTNLPYHPIFNLLYNFTISYSGHLNPDIFSSIFLFFFSFFLFIFHLLFFQYFQSCVLPFLLFLKHFILNSIITPPSVCITIITLYHCIIMLSCNHINYHIIISSYYHIIILLY